MQNKIQDNKQSPKTSTKDDLLLALISYMSPIGWIIAYVMYIDETKKNIFNAFHLRQSLGVSLGAVIIFVAVNILGFILGFVYLPFVGKVLTYIAYIVIFSFYILGVISAANGERRKLPIIGEYFQNVFKNIK